MLKNNTMETKMKICLICQEYCNHITRYCPKVCCKICGTLGHVNIDCKLGISTTNHLKPKKHSDFVEDSSNEIQEDRDINEKKLHESRNTPTTTTKQLQEHGLRHSNQNDENSTSEVSLSTSQIFEK